MTHMHIIFSESRSKIVEVCVGVLGAEGGLTGRSCILPTQRMRDQ